MLKRYASFFTFLRSVTDILIVAGVWIGAYFIRGWWLVLGGGGGDLPFAIHLRLMLPVAGLCYLACLWAGLYRPRRTTRIVRQAADILKAGLISGLLVSTFLYYVNGRLYSFVFVAGFVGLLWAGLSLSHMWVMVALRYLRSKGYNQRYYAVIGAKSRGVSLVKDIRRAGWFGLKCSFFVDDDPELAGSEILGVPVYGPVEKILELANEKNNLDEVYLAMGGRENGRVYSILQELQRRGITLRIVPDWGRLLTTSDPIFIQLGSQVLFSASDSPLTGSNAVIKELFDRLGALLLLGFLGIPMLIIALLIRLTSEGPVFYRQRRVGMDQRQFDILKFRTMRLDAEGDGPRWSVPGDERCTSLGRWLRKTSLDELPQLINVLKGEMSLVGPRPERPCFVKQFSETHRRYMLRHKVKAGMTGLAQVNGLRGDSSLRRRLVHDLYYVRHWSLLLDLWILLKTPIHLLKRENAH